VFSPHDRIVDPADPIAELALEDMVADTERLGLYDVDPALVKAALKAARKNPEG
jgi:hypothetical protein